MSLDSRYFHASFSLILVAWLVPSLTIFSLSLFHCFSQFPLSSLSFLARSLSMSPFSSVSCFRSLIFLNPGFKFAQCIFLVSVVYAFFMRLPY
ncbi:hypothetical protein AMTRI_Chr02g220700 [Amborella trichopoda]